MPRSSGASELDPPWLVAIIVVTQVVGHHQDDWPLSYYWGCAEKSKPLSQTILNLRSFISVFAAKLFICLNSSLDYFLASWGVCQLSLGLKGCKQPQREPRPELAFSQDLNLPACWHWHCCTINVKDVEIKHSDISAFNVLIMVNAVCNYQIFKSVISPPKIWTLSACAKPCCMISRGC